MGVGYGGQFGLCYFIDVGWKGYCCYVYWMQIGVIDDIDGEFVGFVDVVVGIFEVQIVVVFYVDGQNGGIGGQYVEEVEGGCIDLVLLVDGCDLCDGVWYYCVDQQFVLVVC